MPLMMTPVVVGVLWRFLLNPEYGVVDYFVHVFGGSPVTWLAGRTTAFTSILMMEVWQQLPVVIFILAAGISSLPDSVYEAADIDGANRWQRLRLLTLPLLRPVIAVVLLLRIMDCFKVFDTLYTLTYGASGILDRAGLFVHLQARLEVLSDRPGDIHVLVVPGRGLGDKHFLHAAGLERAGVLMEQRMM